MISEPFIVNVVGRPNVNEWNGISKPQILIDDIDYQIVDDTTF